MQESTPLPLSTVAMASCVRVFISNQFLVIPQRINHGVPSCSLRIRNQFVECSYPQQHAFAIQRLERDRLTKVVNLLVPSRLIEGRHSAPSVSFCSLVALGRRSLMIITTYLTDFCVVLTHPATAVRGLHWMRPQRANGFQFVHTTVTRCYASNSLDGPLPIRSHRIQSHCYPSLSTSASVHATLLPCSALFRHCPSTTSRNPTKCFRPSASFGTELSKCCSGWLGIG